MLAGMPADAKQVELSREYEEEKEAFDRDHEAYKAVKSKTLQLVKGKSVPDISRAIKDIGPEPAEALNSERKIQLALGFKPLLLLFIQNTVGDVESIFRSELVGIHTHNVAIDAQLGRDTGGDMKV